MAAPAWVPGMGFTAPAPPSEPMAVTNDTNGNNSNNNNDDVDESDPLWNAVLKISEGDRERAMTLLNDPDQLATYPEITALMDQLSPTMDGDDEVDEAPTPMMEEDTEQLASDVQEKLQLSEEMESHKPTGETGDEADDDMPLTAMEKALKEADPREHFNLVFIGHVDAGKSTLSGNILYLTENVDKRTIERYEKEAKDRNRDSWFLAFIMDTNEEERAKGKTVEVGMAFFDTPVKRYTILDAPGHKNYVPNMIQGASQADVGILVISARKGEFETGFDRGGQTREHAMLAKTLGVDFLIVAVNKMDEPTVQWKKERFDECVNKIRPYLKSCGFTIKKQVKFIPISALGGANVKDPVDDKICPWWKEYYTSGENNTTEPTLLAQLDALQIPDRDQNSPLRLPVLDRYTDRGTIAMGKVEAGTIRPGIKVTIMPTRNVYKVDEVYVKEDPVSIAKPGENVLVKLNGARTEDVRRGYVICTEPPCRAVDKIICQIAIADMPENTKIMTAGFQCMFHAHTCEEECTISKIFETTNNKGQVNKNARFAGVGMRAVVLIELTQLTPLERFDDFSSLGRFTLRTEGKTVAIGKITKLPPKKE